jgi:hypothetical protein
MSDSMGRGSLYGKTALSAVAILSIFAGAFSACGGGGGHGGGTNFTGGPANAIGPGGGTVSGSGSTAGVNVTVPPNAVSTNVTIGISLGSSVAFGIFQIGGPAIKLSPDGQTFAAPVNVTIPVVVPAGHTINEIEVLKRDDTTGAITLLTPVSRDAVANTVTVQVTSFSTVQPVIQAAIDAAKSTVTASRSTGVHADGSDSVTITANVVDTTGSPVSGVGVTFASSGSGNTITPGAAVTDASGNITARLVSTVAETKTVSASVAPGAGLASVPLAASASIVFVPSTSGGGGGNGIPALLAFNVQPASGTAGATMASIQVAVKDNGGNTLTSATNSVTVAIGTNPANGTLIGNRTVAATNGIATINSITIDRAGNGYTLAASSVGLTGALSSTFNMSAAAASQLVFSVQPSGCMTNTPIAPAVKVSVTDSLGNVLTGVSTTVTVSMFANPGAASLGGTLSQPTTNGVATFNDLTLSAAGVGYQLGATAPAVPAYVASSSPFAVVTPAGGTAAQQSDAITLANVQAAAGGNEDFQTLSSNFAFAVSLNAANENAKLGKALCDALAFAKNNVFGGPSVGKVRSMFLRAGYYNPNESTGRLRDFVLRPVPGFVPGTDSPTASDALAFLNNDLSPQVDALNTQLAGMSTAFDYTIATVDSGGILLDDNPVDDTKTMEFTYGDAQVAAGMLQAVKAQIAVLNAYDLNNIKWSDMDRNAFPLTVDPLANIAAKYPTAGTVLAASQLATARTLIGNAINAYVTGANFIEAETQNQINAGMVTLGRGTSTLTTAATISSETTARTWAQNLFASTGVNTPYSITTKPLGQAIDTIQINGFQFFAGALDARSLYFKTVDDPFTGKKTFGMTDPAQITSAMTSANNIVLQGNGAQGMPGDLQAGYAPRKGGKSANPGSLFTVRIDAPPVSSKSIDGSFTDWATGFAVAGHSPQALVGPASGRPDYGDMHVAVDATNLYVRVTAPPANFGSLEVKVKGQTVPGAAGFVGNGAGTTTPFSSTGMGSLPTAASGSGGFEVAIPLANFGTDSFVLIERNVADPTFHNKFNGMNRTIVKIH